MKNRTPIKRGDILYADLGQVVGSEQGGTRPVVVLSNDKGNKFGSTVIVAPITSSSKKILPTHVNIRTDRVHGVVLLEQMRTLSMSRLQTKVDHLYYMQEVDKALLEAVQLEV